MAEGEFSGAAPSLEGLVRSALEAVERGDEKALHGLRVTRIEFERYLWREFPQSRPVTGITAGDAWEVISNGSLSGASRFVGGFGGRRLVLQRVEHSGAMAFRNFTLWRDMTLYVKDRESGEPYTLRFLPAVAERHGRFKAFSFKD